MQKPKVYIRRKSCCSICFKMMRGSGPASSRVGPGSVNDWPGPRVPRRRTLHHSATHTSHIIL